MQTAIHPAFEQKLAVLSALLERSKSLRAEAHAKVSQTVPRYQACGKGSTWEQGFAYSYRTALRFVDAMESGAASKQGGVQ